MEGNTVTAEAEMAEAVDQAPMKVMQINVAVLIDNGYGTPIPAAQPFTFGNDAQGTAADHLIAWAKAVFEEPAAE